MKKLIFILFILIASQVAAYTDLKPGIEPDNPFYFLDKLFDNLQSSESLANEKTAEMVKMVQEDNLKGLDIAGERYKIAVKRRQEEAVDERMTEEITRQFSSHLIMFLKLDETLPDSTRLDSLLTYTTNNRDLALLRLSQMDLRKAERVEKETEKEIIKKTPNSMRDMVQKNLGITTKSKMSALNKSIKCGLIPEKIKLPFVLNTTELITRDRLQEIILNISDERLKEDVIDYLLREFGKDILYWKYHDECPITSNKTELDSLASRRTIEMNHTERSMNHTDPSDELFDLGKV